MLPPAKVQAASFLHDYAISFDVLFHLTPFSSFLKNLKSSVSIATGWKAGGSIPSRGKIFSSLQRPDRLWGHRASYPMGTGGSSSGVRRPGCE
jgi:hypothetical protein